MKKKRNKGTKEKKIKIKMNRKVQRRWKILEEKNVLRTVIKRNQVVGETTY